MGTEGQGVIIGDGAEVLEAEDGIGIERVRPGPVDRLRVGGGLGEARIVAGDEATEERIGVRVGADAGHAELGDKAILQGAEEALIRPLAWGLPAGIQRMPSSWRTRPTWVGAGRPRSCSSSVQGWRGERLKMP